MIFHQVIYMLDAKNDSNIRKDETKDEGTQIVASVVTSRSERLFSATNFRYSWLYPGYTKLLHTLNLNSVNLEILV